MCMFLNVYNGLTFGDWYGFHVVSEQPTSCAIAECFCHWATQRYKEGFLLAFHSLFGYTHLPFYFCQISLLGEMSALLMFYHFLQSLQKMLSCVPLRFCCSSTLLTTTGDDCKGKQCVETRVVQSSSSPRVCRSHHVLGELWLATAYTGYLLSDQTRAYPHTLEINESSSTLQSLFYCTKQIKLCFLLLGWSPGSSVLWVGQKAGSAVRSVIRRMLSVLWLAAVSPGHHLPCFK